MHHRFSVLVETQQRLDPRLFTGRVMQIQSVGEFTLGQKGGKWVDTKPMAVMRPG